MNLEYAIFGLGYIVLLAAILQSPKANKAAIDRLAQRIDGHDSRIKALETARALGTAEVREQVRMALVPLTKVQREQGEQLNEIASVLHDVSNHLHVKPSNAKDAARHTA